MGHNLDMSHDTGDCENNHVMSSVAASGTSPSTWSSCSKNDVKNFFQERTIQLECLDNRPTSQWGNAVCGNGFVEKGEDCDPTGADACCDASSCTFVKGAVCSDADGSKCCRDCQFVPKALKQVCRSRVSVECDIPEYCDGVSTNCPSDVYTYPGAYCLHPILKEVGACYATQCKVYQEQCVRTHQPVFKWPEIFQCMDGIQNGNKRCGDLICGRQKECTSSGTVVQDGTTVRTEDGTPCAVGHNDKYGEGTTSQPQCKGGKCVPSMELAPTPGNFIF
jgi:hypothetical protein